ncbi:MAG: restriction endonuclease subunit S, partial [Kiritimatiellia bacterium]
LSPPATSAMDNGELKMESEGSSNNSQFSTLNSPLNIRLPGFGGEWEVKRVSDLLDYERPDKFIVKNSDYTEKGRIPVLTANKSFVLGFTTENFGVYQNLPVVIFDDFTTDSKFVDFPFKVKSSAIKILKPKSSEVNLRFAFGIMKLVRFPLGEHKRYYISEYQSLELLIPALEEQTAIAAVLSDMDAEIEALEQRRTKTRNLKQGMMQELLTGRVRLVN